MVVRLEREIKKRTGIKWTEERKRIDGEKMKTVWQIRKQNQWGTERDPKGLFATNSNNLIIYNSLKIFEQRYRKKIWGKISATSRLQIQTNVHAIRS